MTLPWQVHDTLSNQFNKNQREPHSHHNATGSLPFVTSWPPQGFERREVVELPCVPLLTGDSW